MKYKIYLIKDYDESTKAQVLIEASFNLNCGFDSIEDAYFSIKHKGDVCVEYVILPYVYFTE